MEDIIDVNIVGQVSDYSLLILAEILGYKFLQEQEEKEENRYESGKEYDIYNWNGRGYTTNSLQ